MKTATSRHVPMRSDPVPSTAEHKRMEASGQVSPTRERLHPATAKVPSKCAPALRPPRAGLVRRRRRRRGTRSATAASTARTGGVPREGALKATDCWTRRRPGAVTSQQKPAAGPIYWVSDALMGRIPWLSALMESNSKERVGVDSSQRGGVGMCCSIGAAVAGPKHLHGRGARGAPAAAPRPSRYPAPAAAAAGPARPGPAPSPAPPHLRARATDSFSLQVFSTNKVLVATLTTEYVKYYNSDWKTPV